MAGRASPRSCRKACFDVIWNIATERRGFVPIRQVAAHAVGRIQCVIIVDVAGSTGRRSRRHVRTRQREAGYAVIKRRRIPAFRGVAVRAISDGKRGTRSRVHWVVRILPSRQMAARGSASIWRNLQIVVVIDMARSARHVRVPKR